MHSPPDQEVRIALHISEQPWHLLLCKSNLFQTFNFLLTHSIRTHYATLTQTESTTTSGTALELTTTTEIEPFTVVVPTTITAVETDIVTLAINVKRQQTESPCEIPAYASACSGAVRYSSACSCVGATRSTVFAAAPTTTVTVTVVSFSIILWEFEGQVTLTSILPECPRNFHLLNHNNIHWSWNRSHHNHYPNYHNCYDNDSDHDNNHPYETVSYCSFQNISF